ncbi:P-loop containing nucleoside triphosphate hydrolase protein [Chytridium lagenaria]|nr:P-loop containing nucleoside triphosphate hydrolase protein [Chytridium lagenaria]
MSPTVFLKSSAFGDRARRLVKLVNTMRDAGAHMDLDLPTVVVCGNQSVGKSSLIEALCGVILPRAEGTCTRSVTEVRMTESAIEESSKDPNVPNHDWRCSIKLRLEFDSTGTPLKAPREVIFVEDIKNPEAVELSVRRAQKALLNPSADASKYANTVFDDRTAASRDKEAASNELKFTKKWAPVFNLTLIDLPGIIRSVDRKEDAQFIDIIQDLVKKYISNDRAIIVGTITCKDEIDNQAIVHMAKDVDPMGVRTIGVLTKPDTIESGTHDRWLQILLGQTYSLKLGYWMVKNPNKADLDRNISFDEARAKEETFFASHTPWSSLRHQLDRFGIDSLRREMSKQLAVLTDLSLPDMKLRTEEVMQATSFELSKLPAPLSDNSRIELLQMIRHFTTVLNYNLSAHQDFKGFYQRIRSHFETFRRSIYSSRPVFALDRKQPSSLSSSHGSSSLTSSVSSAISSVWSTISSDDKKKDTSKASSGSSAATGKATVSATEKPHRKIIDSQKGSRVARILSIWSLTFIVAGFQEEWNKYAVACLSNVSHELHTLIQKLTEEVFGRFTNLHGQVRFVIQVVQSELYRTRYGRSNNLVLMEKRYPFTMGSEEFSRLKSSALHEFKAQLEMVRSGSVAAATSINANVIMNQRQETVNKALAALAEAGYTGLSPKDLARLRDNPEDDEVLHVMAASDAYFRLAFKRLGDNVPMHVDFHFLTRIGEGLEKELVARLGVLEKDAAAVAAMRRKALQEQRIRLENVWRALHEFGM